MNASFSIFQLSCETGIHLAKLGFVVVQLIFKLLDSLKVFLDFRLVVGVFTISLLELLLELLKLGITAQRLVFQLLDARSETIIFSEQSIIFKGNEETNDFRVFAKPLAVGSGGSG